MFGVSHAGSTRLLFADRTVVRTFGFAMLGRLAYGVLPLCFLFTVRDATGSLATAAIATAVIGMASLAMPLQARLVDRYGQRRILPLYAGCHVALLLTAGLLADRVTTSMTWLLISLLLGLAAPALGPSMRAQWREIAAEGPQRRRAYSIDSIAEESVYLVGPIIAGAILGFGSARWGLLLAAGLIACGVSALVTSPHVPTVRWMPRHPRHRGLIRSVALSQLLVVMALFGAGTAATFVGVASLADALGRPGLAGVLEAGMASGAVVGGLLWARFGRSPRARVPAWLLVHLGIAQALVVRAVPYLLVVGVLLAVGALATSPVFVAGFSAADALVDDDRRTEASTWVTIAANLGTSAGTAVAGGVVGLGGSAPFLLAATLSAIAAVVAWCGSGGGAHR